MDQKKIGEFIQKLRKSKKLTQDELADKLGVSSKSVSRWETGVNMPDYSVLNSICEEFNINVLELLNGEKKKEDNKVFEEYMKFKEKVNVRNRIAYFIIMALIIIGSLLLLYFVSNYKNVTVYELSGESDHFYYDSGVFIKSNIKCVMQYGRLSIKSDSGISEADVINSVLSYKKDNDYYTLTSFKNDALLKEDYGYSEVFHLANIDFVPNELYIIIFYNLDNEILHEELKINSEVIMKNDKFINIKKKFISEKKQEEKINFNRYDNRGDYKQFLIDNGFSLDNKIVLKRSGEIYSKVVDKYGQLDFTLSGGCAYFYKDDNLDITMYYNYDYDNLDYIWNNYYIFKVADLNNDKDSFHHSVIFNIKDNTIQDDHKMINKYPYLEKLIRNFNDYYEKFRFINK